MGAPRNITFISTKNYKYFMMHRLKNCFLETFSELIHKNNMVMHLIVSACGTATHNTPKFISKILQNYCGKTSSFVKDSTDFVKKIKHLSINPEEDTLVSYDVSALSTSILVPVALQVVNSKISTCTNFTNVCKIPQKNSSSFCN